MVTFSSVTNFLFVPVKVGGLHYFTHRFWSFSAMIWPSFLAVSSAATLSVSACFNLQDGGRQREGRVKTRSTNGKPGHRSPGGRGGMSQRMVHNTVVWRTQLTHGPTVIENSTCNEKKKERREKQRNKL